MCGTIKMGYGVIEVQQSAIELVEFGVLKAKPNLDLSKRLYLIYQQLMEVLNIHNPSELAVEHPFVDKNVRSAIAIGQAQSLVFLGSGEKDIPCQSYSPREVKINITGYGNSSKIQVENSVKMQLQVKEGLSFDSADAIAVALTHAQQIKMNKIIG